MGIVNVTPDSFSDGGLFLDADAAIAHGRELLAQGADILDVGGESTRPGAEPVTADEEIRRIVEEAHQLARDLLEDHRKDLDYVSDVLMRRETIEREEFIQLLDGKTEEDVFGPDEPVVPQPAPPGPEAPQGRPEREGPRPLPRPGFAGGSAEMRSDDGPAGPNVTS